jgi:hypothetical protein
MKQLIVLIFITVVLYSCGNEATKDVDKNNAQLPPLSFKFTEETFEDKNGIWLQIPLSQQWLSVIPFLKGVTKTQLNA